MMWLQLLYSDLNAKLIYLIYFTNYKHIFYKYQQTMTSKNYYSFYENINKQSWFALLFLVNIIFYCEVQELSYCFCFINNEIHTYDNVYILLWWLNTICITFVIQITLQNTNRELCTRGGFKLDFRFFLYCTARQQTFTESQLLEAWPASIYGHLREWTFLNLMI